MTFDEKVEAGEYIEPVYVRVSPDSDGDAILIVQMPHEYEAIIILPEAVDALCAALQAAKPFAFQAREDSSNGE